MGREEGVIPPYMLMKKGEPKKSRPLMDDFIWVASAPPTIPEPD